MAKDMSYILVRQRQGRLIVANCFDITLSLSSGKFIFGQVNTNGRILDAGMKEVIPYLNEKGYLVVDHD